MAVITAHQLWQRHNYEKHQGNLANQVLKPQQITADEQKFIDEVTSTWHVHFETCPDATSTEILKSIEFETNVKGLTDFYTYQIPAFTFFDSEKNTRESKIMVALRNGLLISLDQRIYHKQGFAYIKISDHIVYAYQDTQTGIKCTAYTRNKPKKIPRAY